MNKHKQLIIGIVLGVSLSISVTIFADSVKYILEKSSSKIIVNGEEYIPKNNILTYNGTTYLPLRDVGDALDLDLNYNNGVISINQKSDLSSTYSLEDKIGENQEKHIRTPEETEQLIKENNIPTDSALAKELRENPDSTLGTSYIKNNGSNKDDVILEIDGCINISAMSRDEISKYANMSISRSTNSLSYKSNGDMYFIMNKNLPNGFIGDVKIVKQYDVVVGNTKGGLINGNIYIDKSFLDSLK